MGIGKERACSAGHKLEDVDSFTWKLFAFEFLVCFFLFFCLWECIFPSENL